MKRTLTVLAVAALALSCAGSAYADLSSCAVADVRVKLTPNIGIVPVDPNVNMGDWQTGSGNWEYDISFQVNANTQEVLFQGAASKLYKADDPNGTEVPPIDLCVEAGITYSAPNANVVGGGDGNAPYIVAPYVIEGFEGLQTETIMFTSSQNGHFDQPMTMEVVWAQPPGHQPMGFYSGKVELCGTIVMP